MPLKSLQTSALPPSVQVRIEPDAARAGDYFIFVSPNPSQPLGPFHFEVQLQAVTPDDVAHPGSAIEVVGEMQPSSRVIPRMVLLGEHTVPSKAEADVTLRMLGGQNCLLVRTEPLSGMRSISVEGRNQSRKDGCLFRDSSIRLTDIRDGASNTLLVGERPPSADGWFGWWYAGMGQSGDGSGDSVLGVREWNFYLPNMCPSGPSAFGPGQLNNQCDALHFWSLHLGGGANFLFADGSVHFLPYSAAPLMPALATRDRGEAVNLPD